LIDNLRILGPRDLKFCRKVEHDQQMTHHAIEVIIMTFSIINLSFLNID